MKKIDVDIDVIRDLAPQISQREISSRLGISKPTLRRRAKKHGIKFTYYDSTFYSKETINEVISSYKTHTKKEMSDRYKNTNIRWRSIVERYKEGALKCKPWTGDDLITLSKMAGLLPLSIQAKYFNRPNANRGSIVSVWSKKIKYKTKYLNGWPEYKAKNFIDTDRCPFLQTNIGLRGPKIYLWVDMTPHIKPDTPPFIRKAISCMSDFQSWLFGEHPSKFIDKVYEKIQNA